MSNGQGRNMNHQVSSNVYLMFFPLLQKNNYTQLHFQRRFSNLKVRLTFKRFLFFILHSVSLNNIVFEV